MATFGAQILQYLTTDADTTAQSDALTAGAKWIINLIPQERLERWANAITIHATNGVDITGYRLFRDEKGFRARITSNKIGARTVDGRFAYKVTDADSLHYATTNDPVVYIIDQTIFIKPALTGEIDGVIYPTVVYTESAVTGFPSEYYRGMILYATIQRAIFKVNDAITSLDALSLSSVTVPSTPPLPTFTYTDAILGNYLSTTVGSFGTPPDFIPPVTDFNLSTVNTYLNTNKDTELGQAELSHQRSKLELFAQDLQNALGEFNSGNVAYQAEIQKVIEQTRLDQQALLQLASDTTNINLQNEARELERQVSEYGSVLGNHNAEIGLYGQNINKVVSEYSQNLQRDSQTVAGLTNLTAALRNELNEFLKGI